MLFIKAFIVLFLSFRTFAYEVQHFIKPGGNFETMASQNTCTNFKDSPEAISCNPALFPTVKTKQIGAFAIGKSDGDSVENTKTILFSNIDRTFLENLFERDNFNSFSFNSGLDFYNPYFYLSYNPYFLLADFLVFNPAFPEISLILIKRSDIRISYGMEFGEKISDDINFSIGATLDYYNEDFLNTNFTLASLAINNAGDLVALDNKEGITADLGFYFSHKNYWFIPEFSLVFKNINSPRKVDSNDVLSERLLESTELIDPYSLIGIGKSVKTDFGYFEANLKFSHLNYFEIYNESPAIGLKHSYGIISSYFTASEYFQTIGLKFKSDSSSVGILYAYEKEIRNFNVPREHSIYINLEVLKAE